MTKFYINAKTGVIHTNPRCYNFNWPELNVSEETVAELVTAEVVRECNACTLVEKIKARKDEAFKVAQQIDSLINRNDIYADHEAEVRIVVWAKGDRVATVHLDLERTFETHI